MPSSKRPPTAPSESARRASRAVRARLAALTLAALLAPATARAQPRPRAPAPPPARSATDDREQWLRERTALMTTLGVWSALNVGLGATLVLRPGGADPATRSARRSFGALGLAYGLINGVLAVASLAATPALRRDLAASGDVAGQRRRSAGVFTANAGLDMFYVSVGAALATQGTGPVARGAGAGFLVQGTFLLGFDAMGAATYKLRL